MIYGINTRKSVLLSDIARGLQETTKLAYTIDRISKHLNNMAEETEIEIRKNYIKEALKYIDSDDDDGDDGDDKVLMFVTNMDIKNKDDATRVIYTYFLRWRIEEYFKAKKSYKWELSLIRNLKGIRNLNMFLTIVMLYSNEHIEKLETNFLSNIILERALQLKEKCIVYFGQIAQGIYEILKFTKTGIKKFQNIKHHEKYKQLELKL